MFTGDDIEGCVSIAIFDDRLEIWSDGSMPFGQTVDDLKRDHNSLLRNPIIADVLYRRGLVEKWGRGTQKIVELCVAAGHPEPEFISTGQNVGVRFLPSGYVAPIKVSTELTEDQRRILEVLAVKPSMSLREISEPLKETISERNVQYHLMILRQLKLADYTGKGRGARWYLIRK
jgi:ATP-dependent DNA helicase RecG